MVEPPIIPYAKLPRAMELPPRMTLPIPSAPLPSYQPLVLPSAEQLQEMLASEEEPQESQQEKEKAKGRPAITITQARRHAAVNARHDARLQCSRLLCDEMVAATCMRMLETRPRRKKYEAENAPRMTLIK